MLYIMRMMWKIDMFLPTYVRWMLPIWQRKVFVYRNKSINYGNAAIEGYFSSGHMHNRMQRITKMITKLSRQTQLFSGYSAVVVTESTTVFSSFYLNNTGLGVSWDFSAFPWSLSDLRRPVILTNIAKQALSWIKLVGLFYVWNWTADNSSVGWFICYIIADWYCRPFCGVSTQ